MGNIGKRIGSALAVLVVMVGSIVIGTLPASAAPERNPVVFVHGWIGADWNWTLYQSWFSDDGWNQLYAWQYDWSQSNVDTAYQLRDKVNAVLAETGADQVDLVTHSMGGLSSRYYIKFLGGMWQVDDWVSIAGPNHGTNAAYGCWTTSCYEMRYESDFLTKLNAGDETPGWVEYGTFRSWCDEIVNPDSSTIVDGAYNTTIGCWEHAAILADYGTYEEVRDFIRW